jgi:hypothetical protein
MPYIWDILAKRIEVVSSERDDWSSCHRGGKFLWHLSYSAPYHADLISRKHNIITFSIFFGKTYELKATTHAVYLRLQVI